MNKIALFIDTDNVSPKHIPDILVNLNKEGNLIYKRAYGDYGKHPNWNQVCVDNGLVPIHQCSSIPSKNSTDMIVVIGIMKLFYEKPDIDTYAIASSDSDYTAVIQFLREHEKRVIVYGNTTTPKSIIMASSSFVCLKEKEKNDDGISNEKPNDLKELKQRVKEIMLSEGEPTNAGLIKQILIEENLEFSQEKYGFKTMQDLLKALGFYTTGCMVMSKKPAINLRNEILKIYGSKKMIKFNDFNAKLKKANIDYKELGFKDVPSFVGSLSFLKITSSGKNVKIL